MRTPARPRLQATFALLLLLGTAAPLLPSDAQAEGLSTGQTIRLFTPNSGHARLALTYDGGSAAITLSGSLALSRDCNWIAAQNAGAPKLCMAWAGTDNILHTRWAVAWDVPGGALALSSLRTSIFRFHTLRGLLIDAPGFAFESTPHQGRVLEIQVGGLGIQLPYAAPVAGGVGPVAEGRLGLYVSGGFTPWRQEGGALGLDGGDGVPGRLLAEANPSLWLRRSAGGDASKRMAALLGKVGFELRHADSTTSVFANLALELRGTFAPRALTSLAHDTVPAPAWYGFVRAAAHLGAVDSQFRPGGQIGGGIAVEFGLPTDRRGLPQDFYPADFGPAPPAES